MPRPGRSAAFTARLENSQPENISRIQYIRLVALSTGLDVSYHPHTNTSTSPTLAVGALSTIHDGVITRVYMMKDETHDGHYRLFEHDEECLGGDAAL